MGGREMVQKEKEKGIDEKEVEWTKRAKEGGG
jgi:hypothetical protein